MQATSVEFHRPTREAVDFKYLAAPSEQLQELTAHLLKVVLALESFTKRYTDMVQTYFAGPPEDLLDGDVGPPDDRRLDVALVGEGEDLFLRVRRTDSAARSIFNNDWILVHGWQPDFSGFTEDEYFKLADSFHCALHQGLGYVLGEVARTHITPQHLQVTAWLTSPDLHGQSGFICVRPSLVLGRALTFRKELGNVLREAKK